MKDLITINVAPTWEGILPAMLAVLESGTAEGRKLVRAELFRMAQVADMAVFQGAMIGTSEIQDWEWHNTFSY